MKKAIKILSLALTLTIPKGIKTLTESEKFTLKDFHQQYFTIKKMEVGMYPIDIGFVEKQTDDVNLDELKKFDDLWIVGYADLNSDNKVDIITLTRDQKSLKIFHFNPTSSLYSLTSTIPVLPPSSSFLITDIFTADLDNDGNPDIICLISPDSSPSTTTKLKFIFQTGFGFAESLEKNQAELSDFFKHHPQPFQIYNEEAKELKTYILYQKFENERKVLSFTKHPENEEIVDIRTQDWKEFVSNRVGCMTYDFVKFNKLSDKRSGVFVDLNMDCRPDLILEAQSQEGRIMEIYYYTKDGFCLVDLNKVPENWSSVAVFHVNNDGSNDLVFLSQDLEIWVFFNGFKLVDEGVKREFCRKEVEWDKRKPFCGFEEGKRDQKKFYKFKLEIADDYELKLPEDCPICRHVIRHTDLDYDTHEDIVINLKKKSNGKNYDLIFKNIPCTTLQYIDFKIMESDKKFENCRFFSLEAGIEYFAKLNEEPSFYSSFMDFGEMGKMGILKVVSTPSSAPKIKAYFNYITHNKYFLKVSPKTKDPLTSSPSLSPSSPQLPSTPHPTSSHCLGCSIQAIETDGFGEKERPFMGTVNYGSNFLRLQLPYKIFGLGRTTNFIHYFSVGIAKGEDWAKEWTPLIPNSHVVVYAFGGDSERWKIKLFVNPANGMKVIAGITAGVIFLLGIVVVCLKVKEGIEDRKVPDQVERFEEEEGEEYVVNFN